MKHSSQIWMVTCSMIAAIFGLGACELNQSPSIATEPPVSEVIQEQPLIIEDYSKYSVITDQEYYLSKTLGDIFVIKDWLTTAPLENSMTVFGQIPVAIYPYQDLDALDFKDPNRPTIVTGLGEGWGKVVFRGEGTAGSAVCTGEFKAKFYLIGGLYPAPTCTLDVDITAEYAVDNADVLCKYDTGLELSVPMSTWTDMFSDVKLPITFTIPDGYLVHYADSMVNVNYDFSYYLRDFSSTLPVDAERQLVYGDSPAQFDVGCGDVAIDFDPQSLPADVLLSDSAPDSVWDTMLTPESQRGTPQP
jgi:hypothetical protein